MQILYDRIRKDGIVRAGNVLKVDRFLNHQMDIPFINEIGKEFKRLFAGKKITKILTIEASGIGIACVVMLFSSIVSRGYTAFEQTRVTLLVDFDPKVIAPNGDRSPDAVMSGDAFRFDELISTALQKTLDIDPDDEDGLYDALDLLSKGSTPMLRKLIADVLERELDVMIIDTAAGITDSVLTFCQAAQDTVVVVCDEPASITDAYALIKVLSRERGVDRIQVVANMARDPNEGRMLYEKLVRVCEKFLTDVSLNYLG